ncbi:MAG: amidophosphoribosyltransferase [Alphaproteobacteria bacterium PA3]|nr:MAG: amidophosphoribosyltransferase [Alphaproteobacteria bacterium PA3]
MTARSQRPYRLGTTLADLIWPPRSLLSDARVDCLGTMEADLWRALDFLYGPGCERCGFPIHEATGPDILCPICLAQPPLYNRARAALAYDDLSKPLVLNLKHGGRKDGLRAFAAWMLEAAPFVTEADQILPVPLHWSRLWQRGYNQAGWLAQALAQRVARPFNPLLLQRKRATPSQNGLSASGRKRNVTGAFQVSQPVAGRSIVLVDDVMTTGATLQACTAALLRAGAVRVDCVALARVVRPTKLDVLTEPKGSLPELLDV